MPTQDFINNLDEDDKALLRKQVLESYSKPDTTSESSSFMDDLRSRMNKSQERIDALAEPSIMDEYIRQNDPEQYKDILSAQAIKSAQEGSGMGIGSPMAIGSLKIPPKFTVPGKWQEGSYSRFAEELPIDFLNKYKGNTLGKTDIEALKKSIQERGIDEPLILSFDPETNKIKLGEGNHRLEALRQLGYENAPVRAYRSYIDDPLEEILGSKYAKYPKVPFKPSSDPIPTYYPADSKPSDIIDFDKIKELLNKNK